MATSIHNPQLSTLRPNCLDLSSYDKGAYGESLTSAILLQLGFHVVRQGHPSPFDLLVNGVRVEVKTAALNHTLEGLFWQFNIHRHGVIDETDVDVYLLVLLGNRRLKVNCCYFLVIPAPLNRKTLPIFTRGLRQKYLPFLNRWENINRAKMGANNQFCRLGPEVGKP